MYRSGMNGPIRSTFSEAEADARSIYGSGKPSDIRLHAGDVLLAVLLEDPQDGSIRTYLTKEGENHAVPSV
jgi:hypothetical protein